MQKHAYVHLCLFDIQLGSVSQSQWSIIPISQFLFAISTLVHLTFLLTQQCGFFFSFYLQCSPVCAAQLLLEKGAFHKIWSTYLRSDQQLLYKSILCQVSTRVIQYVTKYLFCFNKREIFPITSHPKGAEASSYVLWQFNIYLIYFELSEQNTRNRIS